MDAEVIENSASNEHAVIAFHGTPWKLPVPVELRHKRDPMHKHKIACWYVEDATKLIGDMDDYKVMQNWWGLSQQ